MKAPSRSSCVSAIIPRSRETVSNLYLRLKQGNEKNQNFKDALSFAQKKKEVMLRRSQKMDALPVSLGHWRPNHGVLSA